MQYESTLHTKVTDLAVEVIEIEQLSQDTDFPTILHVHPAKTQVSLRMRRTLCG